MLNISLQEVENAPKGRRMNLYAIYSLGIFATELPEPLVIYIDDLCLLK